MSVHLVRFLATSVVWPVLATPGVWTWGLL